LIDEAVELYTNCREQERNITPSESVRRQKLRTTVAQSTLAYIRFMRSAMTPGELIDAAITLLRQITPHL
jgi:hypothetical protein